MGQLVLDVCLLLTLDDVEYVEDDDGDMDEGDMANEELAAALTRGSLRVNSNKWLEDFEDETEAAAALSFFLNIFPLSAFSLRDGDTTESDATTVPLLVSSKVFLLFFLGDFMFI